MATQGERRALLFLAGVALLGAGTRACRARRIAVPVAGLDQQIAAVDSTMDGARAPGRRRRSARADTHRAKLAAPVDLDTASAALIERLPGIGPSLARRIVDDRTTHGPFGCLATLDRVKGIGPAMLKRLDSLVSFSAAGGAACASPGRSPAGWPRQ